MKTSLLFILTLNCFIGLSQTNVYDSLGVDGPDSPVLNISKNNNVLNFSISNPPSSNNYDHMYYEIWNLYNFDLHLKFEGYLVYQLEHDSIGFPFIPTYPLDSNKYKLVFQTDSLNDIDDIYNYTYDSVNATYDSTLMINGNNQGLVTQFDLQEDAFTNTSFDFNKDYCFIALSYAYIRDSSNSPKGFQFIYSQKAHMGSIQKVCLSQLSSVQANNFDDIKISPIPFGNTLSINLGNSKPQKITIVNTIGQTIKALNSIDTEIISFDLSNQSPGIYFVSFEDKNGRIISKKIVKQ